ncbi:GPI inositol-deacylase [Euphorbia peplus]|nr:GPI inositol-deacylase [Euphorbia peplus]
MQGVGAKIRVAVPVLVTVLIGLFGLYGLLKPVSNGCAMTYMYPTYIPISPPKDAASAKYGLYLYHEGWKKIDFNDHLKNLHGVPLLFIPGNGGSYKQVRSLAAECDRAYQGGPLERNFYKEVHLTPEEGGADAGMAGFKLPNQYASRIDWFAVDLEGEHSAMDGRILEEHTEYVVYAIHRILDQYKQFHDTREREGAANSGSLPKSVILVGHSMGGFVARAAVVHPQLRKSAVETVLTLSTPHQSPPLALQPSLGHYFAHVNQEWKKRYEVQTTRTGQMPDPLLSNVVVVSVSGGYNDYQVRSKLESLDDIVPSTHGFMISSTGMKNVWLSMEHQAILWCNQLVVQVSHTLLSLIDSKTGQPFPETTKRLAVFSRMLRSGVPESFNWMRQSDSSHQSIHDSVKDSLGSNMRALSGCPSNINWNNDALERDLYIQATSMTVLAMDGRRRWMDIQKFSSNGKSHFIFVTNLAPCFGVRLHLWPEKGKSASEDASSQSIVEVTSKLVQIPSRAAPRQVEPGSQTEQAPPSAVLQLSPEDMRGFRFLTISVAPRPSLSGRPPPAASMAVGQFFNPDDGKKDLSVLLMLFNTYSRKEIFLEEDHSLAFSLSFPISLGLLPVTISLKTVGCGLRRPELPAEDAEERDDSKLCKLRCFPPVALAWDPTSGLHIFPNLDGEKVIVDSSPALWSSPNGSEKTTVLLLVDPHCSYKMSFAVSEPAAASRFLLLYSSQIVGFSIAVIFFALMRQAHSWDLDLPIPSMLTAVESNLRMPLPFLILGVIPILVSLPISLLMSQPLPSFASFIIVALICYLYANGFIIVLVSVSEFVFYAAATIHVFVKTRWQGWEGNFRLGFLHWFINLSSSFISLKVIRVVRLNPLLVTALTAVTLGCLVHPAFGLFILVLSHAFCCHNALCSFLTASFRSHARRNELFDYKDEGNESQEFVFKHKGELNPNSPLEEKSSDSPNSKSFGDTQLEIFHHRHGLFMLHLLAALMFVPSLVAWLQRIGMGHSFPWLLDSALCIGVILHGVFTAKPECNSVFSFPAIHGRELRLNLIYMLAGYYSYMSGLGLEPYKVFYAMAAVGFVFFFWRGLQRSGKGFVRKKHSHRQ